MNEEELEHQTAESDELNTTPPNPVPDAEPSTSGSAQSGSWSMPEPVFQQSSGYLPQGFEKRFDAGIANQPAGSEGVTADGPSAEVAPPGTGGKDEMPGPEPAVIEVEPQPDLTDELIIDKPALGSAAKTKKSGGAARMFMIFLGLLAIGILLVILVAVAYFLLFPAREATFN
jgi:hypothetical protein